MAQPQSITFEDVRIGFRNFSGNEGQYNRAGDRNFVIFLNPEDAEQMEKDGWNIKFLKPREDEDEPQAYVQVTVGYKGRPPRVMMVTSRGKTPLGEAEVNILDWADIQQSDLIIRPYEWEVNGKTGIKAYLQSIFVTIREDELDLKYADVMDSGQSTMVRPDEQEDAF